MSKKRKAQKKLSNILRPVVIVGGFLLLGIALWQLSKYVLVNFLTIKQLECFVAERSCQPEEEKHFLYLLGKNIFAQDLEVNISQLQAEQPSYLDVKLTKKLPDKVIVRISLREPVGVVYQDSKQAFVFDETGYIFQESSFNSSFVRVKVYEEFPVKVNIQADQLVKIALLISELKKHEIRIKDFYLEDNETLKAIDGENGQVVFGLDKDLVTQVASLQLILSRSKIEGKFFKSLDLRFDKPVAVYQP